MPSPYLINIVDGEGTSRILNGSYDVTANVVGYDNATITPSTQVVSTGTAMYAFQVAATGTLTLHVTLTGDAGGDAVEGATFVRCDANGTEYGTPVVSDANGNAQFLYMPYAASDAPTVYYKQTASAIDHEFDATLQSTTLATDDETIQVANPLAEERTISLTDLNYAGLPIEAGEVTFTLE